MSQVASQTHEPVYPANCSASMASLLSGSQISCPHPDILGPRESPASELHFASNGSRTDRSHMVAGRAPRLVIAQQRAPFYYSRMGKALADQIVDLARKGIIPTPFGVEDFRMHVSGFSETHIITVLANYERNGYMAQRGVRARFERVREGLYKPI
jgi:hypothetical protein